MWWLFVGLGCRGIQGEFVVVLESATFPDEVCPESDWGSDESEPDASIRIETVWDGRTWSSSVAEKGAEPVWGEPIFDGVAFSSKDLMEEGLLVTPVENDTINGDVFGTPLEGEVYVLDPEEVRAREFDVVPGCVDVIFSMER